MVTYLDLLNAMVKREMAILGEEKVKKIALKAGIRINSDGEVVVPYGMERRKLEELAKAFYEECGDITLIGCRILVNRLAKDGNLKLPDILKF